MQWRLRQFLAVVLVSFSAACTDSPVAPTLDADKAGPSRIGAWIPGGPGECDPWQDVNWCNDPGDPGDGACATGAEPPSGAVEVQGCTGPGSPRSSPGDGDDPPPSDTCQTGDPALDSPGVQKGLKDLWTRSNPDAPQSQRLEQGGWIVQESDGSYRMAPFSSSVQGPCSINGNMNAPPGAVAWVHTHPFTRGEVQTICGAIKTPDPSAPGGFRDAVGPNGQPIYPVYDNKPSFPDRELMSDINNLHAQLGHSLLSGVIIDADQTTIYTENPGDNPVILTRCGY
jgi:hypothetical protein